MTEKGKSRGTAFVQYIIEKCAQDTGTAAALRRADNASTEYQCWEILLRFGVDIEKDWERRPFATIAAAVARAKPKANGDVPFMTALARAYGADTADDEKGPAASRLRRLLACTTTEECCRILRPMFSLVESKGQGGVDFGRLLDDLIWFGVNADRIKTRWASDFYRKGDRK